MIGRSGLRVLGETRCADQVIRLGAGTVGLENSLYSGTYVHEWAHYIQFSTTPAGILLSSYRRRCFDALARGVVESPAAARGSGSKTGTSPALQSFLRALELFNRNWDTWSDDWFAVGRPRARVLHSVELEPDSLNVRFAGLKGSFRLPIAAPQIFEAWAWLAEIQYRTLVAGEPMPKVSRDPREMGYTWALFALASRRSAPVEALPVHYVGVDLLCYLFTSLFYDHRVMSAEGIAIPSSFQRLRQELERRGSTAGRVLWQLLRDDPLAKPRSATSLIDVMDGALRSAGLPKLSLVLGETQNLVDTMQRAYEDELQSTRREARERHASLDLFLRMGELDLLGISARNLNVLASKVDTVLGAPAALLDVFEPPMMVFERPDCHEWSVVVPEDIQETERRVLDARSCLRQQISIYEHILEQFVSGSHLGCYGSPEWPLPINACPHAADCLGLAVRRGIEFCVDDEWRRKVVSVLSGIAEAAGENIGDNLVPGFSDAIKHYDEWRASLASGSSDGLLETYLLGLLPLESPEA